MDRFTQAYIECALWSSTDDKDQPMDRDYCFDDIAPETLERMKQDCGDFQEANDEDILNPDIEQRYGNSEQAGHDFWLTRNGHGAGFWDGDWPDDVGERLTKASKVFGSFDLYVGDDGKVYGS